MSNEQMSDQRALSALSDEELVSLARSGNRTAFGILIGRYEKAVAGAVKGMLGDCQEALDVGQETFIRFYKSLDQFRGDAKLSTYLTRIAINLSLNELKRRKRRFGIFKREDEMAHEPGSTDSARSAELKELLDKSLKSLKPEFRSVVVLRLVEGYSTEETADILEIPAGTVLSRLARAQKQMRMMLAPVYFD